MHVATNSHQSCTIHLPSAFDCVLVPLTLVIAMRITSEGLMLGALQAHTLKHRLRYGGTRLVDAQAYCDAGAIIVCLIRLRFSAADQR
jgi:hypothetical protein